MSAAARDQERERLTLPGYSFGMGAPTIATATEKKLRDCLKKDLNAIAHIMKQQALFGLTAKLTREGLAPPEWHEYARKNRSSRNNLAVVEGIERRIRAIRAELARREALRKLEVQSKAKEAHRRLEGIVEHAPVYAGNLQLKASEVEAAWLRINRFIPDLELVVGSVPYVADGYTALRKGAQLAAETLGVPAPEFEPLSSLPSKIDVNNLLGLFRRKGFERMIPNIGDAADVQELVRDFSKK